MNSEINTEGGKQAKQADSLTDNDLSEWHKVLPLQG